jgi:hypothetical protein
VKLSDLFTINVHNSSNRATVAVVASAQVFGGIGMAATAAAGGLLAYDLTHSAFLTVATQSLTVVLVVHVDLRLNAALKLGAW